MPSLTQREILDLIGELKKLDDKHFKFPRLNETLSLNGKTLFTNEDLTIDISRKRIEVSRITLQNRIRKTVQLVRLDIDNKPHRNPNGEKIGPKHIHIYQEGYGDAWAYEILDSKLLKFHPNFNLRRFDTNDQISLFLAFFDYCNFIEPPQIEPTLC